VYARTFGIPRSENKTLIGAVLAVLGVNAVIASFLVNAFNEPAPPPPPPPKRD
jgi:phosphate/sulfate permease